LRQPSGQHTFSLWVLDLLWWSPVSPFPTEALRSFWTWRKWQVFDIEDLGGEGRVCPSLCGLAFSPEERLGEGGSRSCGH